MMMTKEQKVEAYSIILDGYTYQDIADKVGCTRQYIQKLFENVPKIRGISRKRYSSIIYPSIKRYMINHGLSYNEFSRIIYGTEKAPSELKKKLIGERPITLNEAKLIIKATGMTFEEAFRTEGETCSATTTQQRN